MTHTPDLGWLFPRLLAGPRVFRHPTNGDPYIAVQSLGFTDLTSTEAALRRIATTTGLRILLLPLTRCWQDVLPLRALHEVSKGEFTLTDDFTSDLDKLEILGSATLFIGQSMHGFIGALSQGRPAGICLPERDDKFGELLRDLQLLQFRSVGWDGVEALVQTLLWSPIGHITQRRAAAQKQLDAIFDDICDRLLKREACYSH